MTFLDLSCCFVAWSWAFKQKYLPFFVVVRQVCTLRYLVKPFFLLICENTNMLTKDKKANQPRKLHCKCVSSANHLFPISFWVWWGKKGECGTSLRMLSRCFLRLSVCVSVSVTGWAADTLKDDRSAGMTAVELRLGRASLNSLSAPPPYGTIFLTLRHTHTQPHTLPLSHCKRTRALSAVHDGSMAGRWPTRYDVTLCCGGFMCVCVRVCEGGKKAVRGLWEPFVSASKWIRTGKLSSPGGLCCCCSDVSVSSSGQTSHSAPLKDKWGRI